MTSDPSTPAAGREHQHDFQEFMVCRLCGKTEAAINGCHHCNEPQESGLCWWCLKPQSAASVEGREQALKALVAEWRRRAGKRAELALDIVGSGAMRTEMLHRCADELESALQEAGAAPASAVKDMGEPTEYGDLICPECNQQVPRFHRCAAPLVSPQGEE